MKKILTTAFITLALVIGGASVAPAAHAQATGSCETADKKAGTFNAAGQCVADASASAGTTASGDPTKKTPLPPVETSDEVNGVLATIMGLFAWLVGIAAVTLDNVVYYTVVKMGDVVNGLDAIGVAWRILRDIGNIVLLFGFIALGICVILEVNWYGGKYNLLPKLLMAAVLLNFSLFIAEATIDTGNLFATQFYMQINGGEAAGQKTDLWNADQDGIASKLMAQLGFTQLYGMALDDPKVFIKKNHYFVSFLGIFLFLTTALVMFSLALMLVTRFVVLIFVIISSPIGIVGMAVPQLKNLSDKWWHYLVRQTITAPILLLGLYLALAVITDAAFLSGFQAAGWDGIIESKNIMGLAGMLLSFLVAMGLLLVVLVLAKNLDAKGADWAMKWGGRASFGVTAWAGRTALGWPSNLLANQARKSRLSRVPIVGTGITRGLERVASSSFDFRGTSAFKNAPFVGGLNAGIPQKGGYKGDLKKRIEKRTKYAADLKGRELTPDEKAELAAFYAQLAEAQKAKDKAQTKDEARNAQVKIERLEKKIEGLEKETDKGAKRAYADWLLLWSDKNSTFNKYFNLAANTDAAKKIKADAKESTDDKTLKALIKKAKADEAAASTTTPSTGAGGTPAGGAAEVAH